MSSTKPPVVEDQATDSDTASSSAANARVDVHMADDDNSGKQTTFDSVVSDNLIAMLLTQAQNDLALNLATARNLVANSGAALTLGVQQINSATLVQLFKMSPMEARALGLLAPEPPLQQS